MCVIFQPWTEEFAVQLCCVILWPNAQGRRPHPLARNVSGLSAAGWPRSSFHVPEIGGQGPGANWAVLGQMLL